MSDRAMAFVARLWGGSSAFKSGAKRRGRGVAVQALNNEFDAMRDIDICSALIFDHDGALDRNTASWISENASHRVRRKEVRQQQMNFARRKHFWTKHELPFRAEISSAHAWVRPEPVDSALLLTVLGSSYQVTRGGPTSDTASLAGSELKVLVL